MSKLTTSEEISLETFQDKLWPNQYDEPPVQQNKAFNSAFVRGLLSTSALTNHFLSVFHEKNKGH